MIALARLCGWAVGYADEVWWSRVAQPKMQSWSEAGAPLRLQERQVSKEDPDPKALSCYGLLEPDSKTIRLRFVDGRPVSHVTTAFLEWLCQQMQSQGQRVLVLIWDNASWQVSKEVRTWLQQHNQRVLAAEREGQAGVRIIPCWLPTKSPWLNRIEPHWVHGKRAIVEPARLLTSVEEDIPQAQAVLSALQTAGIDYQQATNQLQKEGVQKFIDSFDKLFQCIESKRKAIEGRQVAEG